MALALGCATIAAAYGTTFTPARTTIAPWLMAMGLALASSASVALGALRGKRTPRVLWWTVVFVAVELAGGFGFVLFGLQADPRTSPVVLGLPIHTAVLVYGVGLVPMVLLPLVYALTFDTSTTPDP
jgi:hypothetical protein